MWFNILKNELASKTGFSQLDFDNIVIEDEDDCRKRWQQLCQELEGFTAPDTGEYRVVSDKDGMRPYGGVHSIEFMAKDGVRKGTLWLHYDYASEIPEEVYCKALEVLFDTSLIGISSAKIKDYEITKTSSVSEFHIQEYFEHNIKIGTPQSKYYDLGFGLYASHNSLKTVARKLLEILK